MDTYHGLRSNGRNPGQPGRKPPWRIALVANLKNNFERKLWDPLDAGAEFDRWETIESIAQALESEGHWVHFCEADYTLPDALSNLRPHIVFNIAEGIGGDGREAQVPALCEMMEIPYTGSRVVTQAISLDKIKTKRIWQNLELPTSPFIEITCLEQLNDLHLPYPQFVKPACEGTGMGVDIDAVVHNKKALIERVEWVLRTYHQPALVENFLPGREFTVGFMGNPTSRDSRRKPHLYDAKGYHWFPILEIDTSTSVSPGVYSHHSKDMELDEIGAPVYLCPAIIPNGLQIQLFELTRLAAQALGVSDVSRVDFRLGSDGKPYLLEINTLPGLNPSISDLCIMAEAEQLPYEDLINEILFLAAERYHMPLNELTEHIKPSQELLYPNNQDHPKNTSNDKVFIPY